MIEPSKEFPVLEEFPRARVPFVIRLSNGSAIIRLIFLIFGPVIRWWRGKIRLKINERILPRLISDIGKCQNRLELEKLLGKPKYVLTGKGFESYPPAGGIMVPDIVEIYLKKRCRIDVHFKDNRLESICGMGQMSPWDSVVGVPWEIEARRQEKKHKSKMRSMSDREEKEILDKELNLETFKLFLETYFPMCQKKLVESLLPKLFDFVQTSGKHSKLVDLKEILQKTEKARKSFHSEMQSPNPVTKFAVAYAFIYPEMREKFLGHFLTPVHVKLIEKYEHLVKK